MGLGLPFDEVFKDAADNLGPAGLDRDFPVILVGFAVNPAFAPLGNRIDRSP